MVCALGDGAHILYFCTVNHGKFPFFQKTVFRLWINVPEIPGQEQNNFNGRNFHIYYTFYL